MPYKYPGMQEPVWVDVYNRMYRERIMFLSQPVDDNFANMMIAVMLYLEKEDATSPVAMYCNVPGGQIKAGLAMYDTMRIMPYDFQTVNMGMCADVAAFIVAAGTPKKRFALPNAEFRLNNPRMMPPFDEEGRPIRRPVQASEMQLEVQEVLRDKRRLIDGLASFTGRTVDVIERDFSRDFYLDAQQAVDYGLIDTILQPKAEGDEGPSLPGGSFDTSMPSYPGASGGDGPPPAAAM